MSANATRQDSDRDFLIIADHPLDREIITKLKDGLYDIELKNNEVVSSIIRSRQECFLPEYDAWLFKKAVEGTLMGYVPYLCPLFTLEVAACSEVSVERSGLMLSHGCVILYCFYCYLYILKKKLT